MSRKNALLNFRKLFSKKIYLLVPLLLVAAGSLFFFRGYVTAQDAGQGLTVSPPSQEVTVDPGGTVTIKAKLRNPGNTTLPIAVHIEDFTAKGEEGQVELTADSPYSVASWAKVSPSSFNLAAGETREVTATINAPANAAGGHFGSFVFEVKATNQSGAAALAQEIASLFLIRVSGPVDEKLDLVSFSAPAYSEFGPIPFELDFKNSGNVHTKTYGLVNVTDMFGRKVADVVVTGVNIFPNSNRIVRSKLDKMFLFGNYKATALMYYGSAQTESLSATTTFFVFPTRIAVIILAVIVILYLLRKRLRKSLKALFG